MRRCGSRSPWALVVAARLAPAGPGYSLTCRGRGGGAGRSGVASAGPALESRRSGRLGGRGAGGGRDCACARGRSNGRRRGSEKLEEAERLKGPTYDFCFLFDCYWFSVPADRNSPQLKMGKNVLMCLFCYSRLCPQANNSLPVLACAGPGLSETLLVPLVDVHEVRKSGAPAVSPAYRRAGASCRCKPQLKLNILASLLNWATKRLCCAPPHSEKGFRNYRCRKSSPAVSREGRKEGTLHANKRGAT